jgi:hypothetical protein
MEIDGAESVIRALSKRVATSTGANMIVPHSLRSERFINRAIVTLTCLLYNHHVSSKYVLVRRVIRLGEVFSLVRHITRPLLTHQGNCDPQPCSMKSSDFGELMMSLLECSGCPIV